MFTDEDAGRTSSKLEIKVTENGDKIEISPIKKPLKVFRKRTKRHDGKVGESLPNPITNPKSKQRNKSTALSHDRSFNLTPWGNGNGTGNL